MGEGHFTMRAMERTKKNSQHQFYTPWYAGDPETDNWITYLHRNLHHLEGENIPFANSEWRMDESSADLHDEVLDALYKADNVDASLISVLVVNNVVNLSGEVRSKNEKEAAEKIVRELPEVWSVRNELLVHEDDVKYRF
jgi:hypothetical protein